MRNEFRDSLRIFRRQPAFAAVIVLTLALGISANTAIFSLIYGILLRPFPYREPDRLVRIQSVYTKTEQWPRTFAPRRGRLAETHSHARRSGSAFEQLRSRHTERWTGAAIQLTQLHPPALSILGVTPILGRLFLAEEDWPGGDVHKALISYRLWQDRFSGDPQIIGRAIQTNQTTLTVVGVMPPEFGFPNRADVWTPMENYYALAQGPARIKRRDGHFYPVIARLKPGVTIEQAQADLEAGASRPSGF